MKACNVAVCMSVVVVLSAFSFACGGRKNPVSSGVEDLDTGGKIRLAQSYLRAGRANEAVETLRDAIEKDPDNAGLRNYYGQICLLTNRLDEAEQALLAALQIDPYLTDAHNNLGAVYDRMGRASDAEAEFRKAVADPSYPTPQKAYLNLGLLFRSQQRLDEAIAMLRKAVGIDPKYYQGHYELAATLEATGRLDEAAREYEVAAPDYRDDGSYHYRLGFTYFRLGDRTKAREHLGRVLEVSPGSESAAMADDLLKMLD